MKHFCLLAALLGGCLTVEDDPALESQETSDLLYPYPIEIIKTVRLDFYLVDASSSACGLAGSDAAIRESVRRANAMYSCNFEIGTIDRQDRPHFQYINETPIRGKEALDELSGMKVVISLPDIYSQWRTNERWLAYPTFGATSSRIPVIVVCEESPENFYGHVSPSKHVFHIPAQFLGSDLLGWHLGTYLGL